MPPGPESEDAPAPTAHPAAGRLRREAEERVAEAELRRREAEGRLEELLARRREEEEEALGRALHETEARLAEAQRQTEDALKQAVERLEKVEARASAAEARAERAERLAQLKADEAEGNRPLPEAPGDASINLNAASYEQLRSLRLSVTQVGRVLAYRQREGGFNSLDELERIPGFPRAQLDELRRKLTV
jgi:DNA uptake protein ComE-like DNA-binding protein